MFLLRPDSTSEWLTDVKGKLSWIKNLPLDVEEPTIVWLIDLYTILPDKGPAYNKGIKWLMKQDNEQGNKITYKTKYSSK